MPVNNGWTEENMDGLMPSPWTSTYEYLLPGIEKKQNM